MFERVLLTCALASAAALAIGGASFGAIPSARPAPADRKFNSSAVESLIAAFLPRFLDPDIGTMFSNCLPNTLDTAIVSASHNDTFVITGDIPAMWLRDSTNEVLPYMALAADNADPALADMLHGLVMRQARSVLIDSYANAYNIDANGNGHQDDKRKPPMTPAVFEGKFETDSLAAVLKSSWAYFNATADASLLAEPDWLSAMEAIIDTLTVQQKSTAEDGNDPAYTFDRAGSPPYPNAPANRTGLTKCGFRPSDDNTALPFLISANAMAAVELGHLADIAAGAAPGSRLAVIGARAAALAATLRAAIEALARHDVAGFGSIYAYEIDGFGGFSVADDSNIPSLLSLPYLGYVDSANPTYVATRKLLLSSTNPYYYVGSVASGIGSPHTPAGYIWPMALSIQALTSTDDDEIATILTYLKRSALATGFMHESFDKNDATHYTRPWFSWANSVFAELIIKLAAERPHLIFTSA
jgi:meiotically up-regulated gene 157 (Mug157) protein